MEGMRWEGHVARMKEKKACCVAVRKPERKRRLGRPRRRWEDNIKTDLKNGMEERGLDQLGSRQ